MNIESLREFCLSLPHVTEDVKWGHDLCFSIGGKMFCVTGLSEPWPTSFKVTDENFTQLIAEKEFMPAPYMARHKWVMVNSLNALSDKQIKLLVNESYEMIKGKLSKKLRDSLIENE